MFRVLIKPNRTRALAAAIAGLLPPASADVAAAQSRAGPVIGFVDNV
jgi:hypothetical protein